LLFGQLLIQIFFLSPSMMFLILPVPATEKEIAYFFDQKKASNLSWEHIGYRLHILISNRLIFFM